MDENECLVGELRKYLSAAKYTTQDHESEQVQALKRDLNLAARVGQQLLMQLQSAEKSRATAEKELAILKEKNGRLAEENNQLACEHELMTESILQQESEISSLMSRLKDAQSKTDRLRRAIAAAKALEREVQLLEHIQVELRTELERRTQEREDAQRLAKHLASSLAQHVASDFQDLKRDLTLGDAPSLTLDTTKTGTVTDSTNSLTELSQGGNVSISSMDSELDFAVADLSIKPKDTATPLKRAPAARGPPERRLSIDRKQPPPRLPPPLIRSLSHESVLSIVQPPALPVVSTASKLETTALPKAVTAISDEHSLAQGPAADAFASQKSARDRLSQMRSTHAVPDRRRWAFTPFRALH